MQARGLVLLRATAVGLTLGLVPAVQAGASSTSTIAAIAQQHRSLRVVQTGGGVVHPLTLEVQALDVNGTPLVTSGTPTGYTPAQIRAYLGLSTTGTGQTIAIVTAYDEPNIAADLAAFDTTFSLAAPPSFKRVNQSGGTTYPTVSAGWALETALDVEWAHAVAPGASILLVEATTSSFTNLDTAIAYAAKQTAVTVISNSWGSPEFSGETTVDSYCKQTAKICVFSSGDNGNPGLYPAASPYVLAVGGTTLQLDSAGTVLGESAWSGSGGGASLYEKKPSYQSSRNATTQRGIPDVSYDADPATGFPVYDSVAYSGQSGWFQLGGTSAGAPQWAGIIAVADQQRKAASKSVFAAWNSSKLTYPTHAALYAVSTGMADITTGTNGTCGSSCTASAGYDFVTGLGSPRLGIDSALKGAA
jgi:subtilase family serine protease